MCEIVMIKKRFFKKSKWVMFFVHFSLIPKSRNATVNSNLRPETLQPPFDCINFFWNCALFWTRHSSCSYYYCHASDISAVGANSKLWRSFSMVDIEDLTIKELWYNLYSYKNYLTNIYWNCGKTILISDL